MTDRTLLTAEDALALHPAKYTWAWDMYLADMDNHWTPREIQMHSDVATYTSSETPEAFKFTFLAVMSMLTTFDVKRGQDAAVSMMGLFEAPEIKQYFQRLIGVEALHTYAYQYCVENLQLDPMDIYRRYRTVPEMAARIDYANTMNLRLEKLAYEKLGESIAGREFVWSSYRVSELIKGLVFWFLGFEGVWFVMSLTGPIQNMARQRGKHFENTAEQFQYILRNKGQHIRFGLILLATLKQEHPEVWTARLKNDLVSIMESVIGLEDDYIWYVLPSPMLGYTVAHHQEMTRYIAARRLRQLGIRPPKHLDQAKNVIPWLSEMMELKKEANFFEARVMEYQQLKWD